MSIIYFLMFTNLLTVALLIYILYVLKVQEEEQEEPGRKIIEIPISVESEKEKMDLDSMYWQELERRRRKEFDELMNYDTNKAYMKRSELNE